MSILLVVNSTGNNDVILGVLLLINRHTPSGQSQVYQVTLLGTDGVRRRESAGKGSKPQVLPSQITMDQLICASLSHTHYWYEVCMLKISALSSSNAQEDRRR